MLGGHDKFVRRLRQCAVCGSRALAGPYSEDLDEDNAEMSVRCGECGTWRSAVMPIDRVYGVERKIVRIARRGRRDIEDELRRVLVGGIDADDIRRAGHPHPSG